MNFKFLITACLLVCASIAAAQTILIKGKVSDQKNNTELFGVTVKVGEQATRTDKNGHFEIAASLKVVTENGISFSHIGYLNTRLIYQPNHFYEVDLLESNTELKEVIIGIKGEDIIKKAIKKIPQNYSNKPTVIKGILRIQKWRNNSQYFKSDAVLKAYIPPYTSSEATTVEVLSNQLDTVYDETLKYMKNIGSYNLVEFGDIAHNKEVLNKLLRKRKFDYRIVGKQIYNGHKVYVVNSLLLDSNKRYNKLEATLYIDTATYAFVAANLNYFNIPRIGPFIARKEIRRRVSYEKIGEKWYLAEAHSKIIAEYKNEEPYSVSDFIRTDLDTNNAEKIAYKDIVQKMDDIFLVKKSNSKEWTKYESLFKNAEFEGKLEATPQEKLDTIKKNNIAASLNYKKPFGRKIYDYIRGNNIRSIFAVTKLPLSLSSTLYEIPESITYGLGVGSNYRLYKNVFIGFQLQYNIPNKKKIGLSTIGLNLSNDFVFNKNARNIVLTPHVGVNGITTKIDNGKVKYNLLDYGLRASYELTHEKALFVASSFNSASGSKKIKEFTITPSPTAISIGIVIKN